jgi:hypothetical protein
VAKVWRDVRIAPWPRQTRRTAATASAASVTDWGSACETRPTISSSVSRLSRADSVPLSGRPDLRMSGGSRPVDTALLGMKRLPIIPPTLAP